MLCKVMQSKEAAQREADILMALSHPNIVRSFGVDGSTCLLMEYLEGPSLHQLVKSRPKRQLGVDDALRISIYIGAALSHVHDRGLLHLDVKPANIVVVNERPILCDFGIARWQADPRPSSVGGTDDYVAPEECRLEAITPAADIFGLGVMLYELLTGHLPFPEKQEGGPYPQILQSPSSVRKHRAAIPVGLEKLVLSCLGSDPKARPALPVLLPALNQFISSGPPMWPPGFQPKMRRDRRRKQPT
jgi:eukaryotic-like serine/threonine-protein kinase